MQETESIEHRILLAPDISGELLELVPSGDYDIEEVIAQRTRKKERIHAIKMYHRWPVRMPRPYQTPRSCQCAADHWATHTRYIFSADKGGKAAVPGPFGAGKTVVQQQIARWSNADIVIYVGCGERGNELVDILETFPELIDPNTGRKLMERTLLVANTSNMPVVAREASVYIGVTLAEYFRDQGYDVVMVADSTSRWAEALREVAGRLGRCRSKKVIPRILPRAYGVL